VKEVFAIQKGNIHAIPVMHYTMELASQVHLAFQQIKPDCVAVEFAETMQLQILHAASRLPDISVVISYDKSHKPIYYLAEPCDAGFEALRTAQEQSIPAFCIDLDVDHYPEIKDPLPDPYAIQRIGLEEYYKIYREIALSKRIIKTELDEKRELYMAKRLKELSLSYDRILFIGGMVHIESILDKVDLGSFPPLEHAERNAVDLCTLTEESCRDVMGEFGWISTLYEESREDHLEGHHLNFPPDRQKMIYQLYREAAFNYEDNEGFEFPGYNMRNLMKYVRNYSLITNQLMPDLYQILTAAKGCVEHNYAYEVWLLGTEYPYLKNVDNLPELDLSIEEIWGHSKHIRFHLRQPGRKPFEFHHRGKDKKNYRFEPPGPFSICSYPPEDIAIEDFGTFLQKKGTQIYSDEGSRTVPFTTSLEDGIDTKESIRHWSERKLYVKMKGKPPGGVGSVCVIFDEDSPSEDNPQGEKFSWRTTWLGEHEQESDMSFYATPMGKNVVGPGITRCEYGGFMMSYPPRRMFDIWHDSDYKDCRSKPEALLMAAIDYAIKPIVVYVAAKPPPTSLKNFAKRFGKKVIYIPIGQLSPVTVRKIRTFHVLDGHDKRDIANEYIK
jgi:hypothetical protein